MSLRQTRGWAALTIDSWHLGAESVAVIWLRSIRLMLGGKRAEVEAARMVSEKMVALATFWPMLLLGGIDTSPRSIADKSLQHYLKPVRANRRRLSR